MKMTRINGGGAIAN